MFKTQKGGMNPEGNGITSEEWETMKNHIHRVLPGHGAQFRGPQEVFGAGFGQHAPTLDQLMKVYELGMKHQSPTKLFANFLKLVRDPEYRAFLKSCEAFGKEEAQIRAMSSAGGANSDWNTRMREKHELEKQKEKRDKAEEEEEGQENDAEQPPPAKSVKISVKPITRSSARNVKKQGNIAQLE